MQNCIRIAALYIDNLGSNSGKMDTSTRHSSHCITKTLGLFDYICDTNKCVHLITPSILLLQLQQFVANLADYAYQFTPKIARCVSLWN